MESSVSMFVFLAVTLSLASPMLTGAGGLSLKKEGTARAYFANDEQSEVASLACFHPLWAGLATGQEARRTAESLPLFERGQGVAVCEPMEGGADYQWGFPNAWPPLTYATVRALD